MNTTKSPWVSQLREDREIYRLNEDRSTDVAVIGAGIAGITTAYFILKNTDHKVALVEAYRVAHGATGHNAGQIVSYFERQISDLVKEFGIDLTAKAQRYVDSAWDLLEEMYKVSKFETPFAQFTGYAGCQDLEEVLIHLENNKYASKVKVNMEHLYIAEGSEVASQIDPKYDGLYKLIPHEQILEMLETEDTNYIAAVTARKGVMNSALFCEEVLGYMQVNYPDRFVLFEESPVSEVVLEQDKAILKIRENDLVAKNVVLCTNGFEKFDIRNNAGPDINTNFHQLVNGIVGYMAGYLEENMKSPIAISYLPKSSDTGNPAFDDNPYFYLTRRNYVSDDMKQYSLICVGGPETHIEDTTGYTKGHPYPEEAQQAIDEFLHTTYKYAPKSDINYKYIWHGLMCYTPNGVRCVGFEPINPVLLYNLGCNGIGILPSIYGSKRISQLLSGEDLEKSIFDPRDSRKDSAS